MKRFLIVCLCLFLLSLFCIPAFADERFVDDISFEKSITPGVSYSSLIFYSSVTYSHPSSGTAAQGSGSLVISGTTYRFSTVYVQPVGDILVLSISGNVIPLIDSFGHLVSGWDGVITFDSPTVLGTNFSNWYNSQPFPFDVDDGVSSFISWTGFAIRDIINSPFILPLIGLSVALFLALPWGISKIKSLIKGY